MKNGGLVSNLEIDKNQQSPSLAKFKVPQRQPNNQRQILVVTAPQLRSSSYSEDEIFNNYDYSNLQEQDSMAKRQNDILYEAQDNETQNLKVVEEELENISIDSDVINYEEAILDVLDTGSTQIFKVVEKNQIQKLQGHSSRFALQQNALIAYGYVSYLAFRIIKSTPFENLVLTVIILNTIILMITDPLQTKQEAYQNILENFFLIFYTIEMSLKILGLGFIFNKGAYLRDGWNFLDFIIVVTSLIPLVLGTSSVNLSALRSLRVLRPLRTISTIHELKVLLQTLFSAIPQLLNTLIILLFFFLVFAIAGLQLFSGLLRKRCYVLHLGIQLFDDIDFICGGDVSCGGQSPEIYFDQEMRCGKMIANPNFGLTNFDDILYSLVNVFQAVTLESWTDIMYKIFAAFTPFTVVYFVLLVFLGAYFLLNLTLAVIKVKFTEAEQKDQQPKGEEQKYNNEEEEPSSEDENIPSVEKLKAFRRKLRNRGKDTQSIPTVFQSPHNQEMRSFEFQNVSQSQQVMLDQKLKVQKLKLAKSGSTLYRTDKQTDGKQTPPQLSRQNSLHPQYANQLSLSELDKAYLFRIKRPKGTKQSVEDRRITKIMRDSFQTDSDILIQDTSSTKDQLVPKIVEEIIEPKQPIISPVVEEQQKLRLIEPSYRDVQVFSPRYEKEKSIAELIFQYRYEDNFKTPKNRRTQKRASEQTQNEEKKPIESLPDEDLQMLTIGSDYHNYTFEVLNFKYRSQSEYDVMERVLINNQLSNLQKLEFAIRNKHYQQIYQIEDEKVASDEIPVIVRVPIRRGRELQSSTNQFVSNNTIVPQVQRKSIIIGKRKIKRKQTVVDLVQHNYNIIRNLMMEQDEVQLDEFKIPYDAIYVAILERDYVTGTKHALNYSGNEILTRKFKQKRENKIRRALSTENQYSYIYLEGLVGFISVLRQEGINLLQGKLVENFLTMVVILNTILLSLTGLFKDKQTLRTIQNLNLFCTYTFIAEMGLKVSIMGPLRYLRDKMNIFDGLIVILSILEMTLFTGKSGKAVSAFRAVRIFRTFRVLRVTRLLRSLQFMQVIIQVVTQSVKKFIYICVLLYLFLIIYALLGMQIYAGSFNFRDNTVRENFDDFLFSFLSCFQLLTMENWNDILMNCFRTNVNPFLTALYLISWIFMGNFVFLNLFLAILIDGFCHTLDVDEEADDETKNHEENFIYHAEHDVIHKNRMLLEAKLNFEKEKQAQKQKELAKTSAIQTDYKEDMLKYSTVVQKPLYYGIACQDSLYIFAKQNVFRILCYRIVNHKYFENLIFIFIGLSSFKLAIDTYLSDQQAIQASQAIDIFLLIIFTLEAFIKIIAFGFFFDDNSYLRESWCQLDFFIVLCGLIDASSTDVNIPIIKILRLLRTLRPLRLISHNKNMKIIVIALLESVSGMMNVMIVVSLIWLMFAILGMSLLGNRMGMCDVPDYYGISKAKCLKMGHNWIIQQPNFDNIYWSMTSLFILSTLENWNNDMYSYMDSDLPQYGPSINNYKTITIYVIGFIMVGSFFLINLFIGVICLYFEKASANEKKRGNVFLTSEQENWIEIQRLTIAVKTGYIPTPKNLIRKKIFQLTNSWQFDGFIMICIVLNIVTMAITYEGSSAAYNQALEKINLGFTSVFITETCLKLLALGPIYFWNNTWNRFDLFVVTTSIIDISFTYSGSNTVSFLRVGPQLIRIVRVLRVTRLLKLIKSMRGLQKLIQTLLYSLPSLLNIGALLLLVFFIYAVLGVFLFSSVKSGQTVTKYNNFWNFGWAMLTLLRACTGENWWVIMFDMLEGSPFAVYYFLSFVTIQSFIMLNLFILIIIQYFENYNLKEDNPLDLFHEKLDQFRNHFNDQKYQTNGEKISEKYLIQFLNDLEPPLGYKGTGKQEEIAKDVMNMHLTGDGYGYIFFNELLFASMKRVFGSNFSEAQLMDPELHQVLTQSESVTKLAIEKEKQKQFQRQKVKYIPFHENEGINPLVTYLTNKVVFLSWKNFAIDQRSKLLPLNEEECCIIELSKSKEEDSIQRDGRKPDAYSLKRVTIQSIL